MYEIIKKSGIIFGHVVCIIILVFCFVDCRKTLSEQAEILPTIKPELTATTIPTSKPTATVTPTSTPEPTATVTPTSTPEPTATVTPTPTLEPTATVTPAPTLEPSEETVTTGDFVVQNIFDGVYALMDNTKDNWWFKRKENQVPSGSGEAFKIRDYQGFYRNTAVKKEDKVIYLTIDCGYDSPNTMLMLDIFKKHDITVTFFVTNFFMEDSPKELKRMVEEGHTIANHSVSHADLTALTEEEIYQEIVGCAELFYEMTGTKMAMFFRPPEGAYSKRTMQIVKDLGYKTIFWSIAYRDFDRKNQPGKQYVLDHFATYHHNGAIPLMHNDSDSNVEAMDELIIYLKEQGYRFGTLDELE